MPHRSTLHSNPELGNGRKGVPLFEREFSETTFGLTIVGHAQAGKTTLRQVSTELWQEEFDPRGEVLDFSMSNGYRGLTAAILMANNAALTDRIDHHRFIELLDTYLDEYSPSDLAGLLSEFYRNPQPDEVLRSAAVDSAVAISGEHTTVRPAVNTAGAKYLGDVLRDPGLKQLSERPSLVVLDGRNKDECAYKFTIAGVALLSTFVLSCPESVIAARKYDSPEDRVAEAERLKLRNRQDRRRKLGSMTLPTDLKPAFYADKAMGRTNEFTRLSKAGYRITENPDAGVVIRTDKMTISEEKQAMRGLLTGMLRKQTELRGSRSVVDVLEYAHA